MPEPSRRARVVVVDDSRFHREFARQVLQGEADVECCQDSEQALRPSSGSPPIWS
jgi:PleD family two-component response regulator